MIGLGTACAGNGKRAVWQVRRTCKNIYSWCICVDFSLFHGALGVVFGLLRCNRIRGWDFAYDPFWEFSGWQKDDIQSMPFLFFAAAVL